MIDSVRCGKLPKITESSNVFQRQLDEDLSSSGACAVARRVGAIRPTFYA